MRQVWQQTHRRLRNYGGVSAIALGGLLLSVGSAVMVQRWETAQQRDRFERKATEIAGRLQTQVDDYAQLTRAAAALYEISGSMDDQQFQALSQTLLPYADGLSGWGWAEAIASPPATHDAAAFATRYLELKDPNITPDQTATHDPARQVALANVVQSGVPITTPLIPLEVGEPGFVLYQPVMRPEPATEATATDTVAGVVFGLYTLKDWVETAIATLNLENISFALYQLPVDQLESAFEKPRVRASDSFVIAYDSEQQDFTTADHFAELDGQNAVSTAQDVCPYSHSWAFCLRSLQMEGREFSLLLLPPRLNWWMYRSSVSVLLLGLGLTLSLTLYLGWSAKAALHTSQEKRQLEQVLAQLKQTQTQLVQTEKLSSLGQLVAGLAHEINNPINFVSGNIQYLQQYVDDLTTLLQKYETTYPEPTAEIAALRKDLELDFLLSDLTQLTQSIAVGAERVTDIVKSMRNFSRLDEAAMKAVDVQTGIESTLLILNSRLKAKGLRPEIIVHRQYGDLPLIECYAGQLNQVFMNILANAIDAIADHPEPQITITTCCQGTEQIEIAIADNGPGIPPEVQPHLFEPFFTTKPVGKGTGLGLSISYQVVTEHHRGQLLCESSPESGTRFRIILPVRCPSPRDSLSLAA
ncbi:MAG: ATP-binding protein [Spirulinaceae cyanobacterium]